MTSLYYLFSERRGYSLISIYYTLRAEANTFTLLTFYTFCTFSICFHPFCLSHPSSAIGFHADRAATLEYGLGAKDPSCPAQGPAVGGIALRRSVTWGRKSKQRSDAVERA